MHFDSNIYNEQCKKYYKITFIMWIVCHNIYIMNGKNYLLLGCYSVCLNNEMD